jgi:hypothetical protein
MQAFSNLPLVENIETLLQSMYVFLDSLSEEAHGTWEVGRNLVNKRSKDPLLCQNLVDLHAYTCQMGFGWVQNSCHEDGWWPCREYSRKKHLWIVMSLQHYFGLDFCVPMLKAMQSLCKVT